MPRPSSARNPRLTCACAGLLKSRLGPLAMTAQMTGPTRPGALGRGPTHPAQQQQKAAPVTAALAMRRARRVATGTGRRRHPVMRHPVGMLTRHVGATTRSRPLGSGVRLVLCGAGFGGVGV